MSINQAEYQIRLRGIVRALRAIAASDGDDYASVQISTYDNCILRVGVTRTEHLTIEEFAKRVDKAAEADFEE